MAIAGIGIDLVEIDRFERFLKRKGSPLLRRVFTARELRYARSQKRPAMHLAARFAVKEAVLKAMKTGWAQGVSWKDIETLRPLHGAPVVKISGIAERIMRRQKIARIHISIAHSGTHAAAFALAEKR